MVLARLLRFLAVIALFATPAVAAETNGYAQPFSAAAFETAVRSGEPVLVEVAADWCPTCRAQQAILSDLLDAPEYARLKVFEVDFDAQKDVVRSLNARMQSTLIVFSGGAEVGRSVGDTSPDGIRDLVRSAL
jgi:thioredoxin-like negative regulator of GroEL